MKLWLIRHGMTRLSEEGRYQGSLDEGLSSRGREALAVAGFVPEQLYVSPALRARETAEILFPDVPQIVIPALREMDFGAFDGRGWWEMERDADYRRWVNGGCNGRCPEGEDRTGFSKRVCSAMEIILRESGEQVAVVAHGGTMMAALEHYGEPAREYWRWQLPCGWGWLLDWDRESEKLLVLREESFLR